jgi:starvation-inducible outer membrane lipoprotein
MRTTSLIILAALAVSACATPPPPAPDPTTDPDLQAAQQADHSGPAVGLLTAPAGRWLGAVILQMFQNIKLNIDIKLDNPQNPPPTTPKAKP